MLGGRAAAWLKNWLTAIRTVTVRRIVVRLFECRVTDTKGRDTAQQLHIRLRLLRGRPRLSLPLNFRAHPNSFQQSHRLAPEAAPRS